MTSFELKMPRLVYAGANALDSMVPFVEGRYKKVAVFTDRGIRDSGTLELPLSRLRKTSSAVELLDDLVPEPSCEEAQKAIDRFTAMKADLIVAVGGGSVMDVAKLASIAAGGSYGVRDLLQNPRLGLKTVPTLMIPTTAGTGAEATPNAIVAVPEQGVKVGIVNDQMIADAVILDGAMIRLLPKRIASFSGIDALCHAIECYTSRKANAFSDLFAMEAMKLIFPSIVAACEDQQALDQKDAMLRGSFYAGVAIAASGTTAVHALSYPLGGKYHIPHGAANAIMLMPVMRFNRPACLEEFGRIYDALDVGNESDQGAKAEALLALMGSIVARLGIPTTVEEYRVPREDLEDLVAAGMGVQRLLANNKRELGPEDARRLYREIL
jgi:Alcohol dehydrogenase, class IV